MLFRSLGLLALFFGVAAVGFALLDEVFISFTVVFLSSSSSDMMIVEASRLRLFDEAVTVLKLGSSCSSSLSIGIGEACMPSGDSNSKDGEVFAVAGRLAKLDMMDDFGFRLRLEVL